MKKQIEKEGKTVDRKIPHDFSWYVAGIRNSDIRGMVFRNYVKGYFTKSEVDLELVAIDIRKMVATFKIKEREES